MNDARSYLNELNAVQQEAVTTIDGPVLVIAGPGSGKTRVLTYRIAHLIQSGIPPWEILTLTFTNKAAREMKERIERVVGERAGQVWAGTFHSTFARLLRSEATRIGYSGAFTIYDTDDTTSLLRNIIKEKQLDTNVYSASAIRSRISLSKSNLISPRSYRENEELMAQDRQARRPFLVDIYETYVNRCMRAGAMDFDDLLFQLYRLFLQHPDVLDKYRARFRFLHVDEFQDTNFLQYAILRQLVKYPGSPENIFAVGDDAQSIYAFRGATIDNILNFERDFERLKTFRLEQNYRSTHHIVSAANELISHNRRQLKKTIWTAREERHKIRLLRCQTDDEEAKRVADLILEMKHRMHYLNSDFAVLYRTNAQSRKIEEHLRRLNLTYKVYGGTSFYQRKEVKDLIAYLRLAVNPYDEEALRRVINYPTRGISPATVEKIAQVAEKNQISLWDAIPEPELGVTDRAKNALQAFRKMVETWAARVAGTHAYELADAIYAQSGLKQVMESDDTHEGQQRAGNVQSVLDAIGEFVDDHLAAAADVAGDETSLAAYLQSITLLTDADEQSGADHIALMSVHAAKGLEFKSVFVTGLEEQLFPSFMSFEDPNGLDEERRLFYVAITRAKEQLTVSCAQTRYRYGQLRQCEPSRFLQEIGTEHFEQLGGIGSGRAATPSGASPRASVSGNFSRPQGKSGRTGAPVPTVDPATFKPSAPDKIRKGCTVRHLKFGEGEVIAVEGPDNNKVATIRFRNDEIPERRIVLKFAKLEVV